LVGLSSQERDDWNGCHAIYALLAKQTNSLVWLVWHMARAEDVPVNLVVARGDQVLDEVRVKRLAVA